MRGTPTVPFSELFKDTVLRFGVCFAYAHYVCKHGMAEWEFDFWERACLR